MGMRRTVALFFHAPGLRLLYDERLTPQLARANVIAVAATIGFIALIWTTSPTEQRVLRAALTFVVGHMLWGSYLAWRLPPKS